MVIDMNGLIGLIVPSVSNEESYWDRACSGFTPNQLRHGGIGKP
jgi:hypothetical protein